MSNVSGVRSKISVKSKELVQAVDHVLLNYCGVEPFLRFTHAAESIARQHDDSEKSMLSENLVTNELNAELWDRALITLLGNLTLTRYPHFVVVQKFINYALNASFVDYGMLSIFFTKLVSFHPPRTAQLQQFYWLILNDRYVTLHEDVIEEQNVFWCLVEALTSCLENAGSSKDCQEGFYDEVCHDKQEEMRELLTGITQNTDNSSWNLNKKIMTYFENLTQMEKLRRVLLLLRFVCQVLESDMAHRTNLEQAADTKANRSLLSMLLWQDMLDLGMVNAKVKELINLFGFLDDSNGPEVPLINELFCMLAETVRRSDVASAPVYPFFGNNTKVLAYNVSLKIIQSFEGKSRRNAICVKRLEPHWLRLLVSSNLITYLTGKFCPPELSSVCEVLEFVVKTRDADIPSPQPATFATSTFPLAEGGDGEKARGVKRTRTLSHLDVNTPPSKSKVGARRARKGAKSSADRDSDACRPRGKDAERSLELLMKHSGIDVSENSAEDGPGRRRRIEKSSKRVEEPESMCFRREDAIVVCDLCLALIVSYFITHRTWDVYGRLKGPETVANADPSPRTRHIKCDYLRYHGDIKKNIIRLRTLVPRLEKVKEFKTFSEPLTRALFFNV